MTTAKLHPSLPAPVVHASYLTASRSKSHVLAGVQDAYWSDDEAEDAECPLCLEEMDVSDLNFKPCQCGYQICRFCWHHIKENLNGRCPACRREYTDDAVQFKPIAKEDHKRLTQQRKQRDRERKELDALNRRHLLNVRVVQRNVVYVLGIGSRFAKEELISTLRSNDYFGQYGKISKILLVKRTPNGGAPVVGLYVTYHRREDASRAISAVDGSPSPGGGHEVMQASHGCMDLHEWGDEKDCFTKEDLTTLKHTMKDSESRQRTSVLGKKSDDLNGGLTRVSGWATKGPTLPPSVFQTASSRDSSYGPSRRGHRSTRSGGNETRSQVPLTRAGERRPVSTKAPSQASSSRPTTPALPPPVPRRPASPVVAKQTRTQEEGPPPLQPSRSRSSSIAVQLDLGAGSQDVVLPSESVSSRRTDPSQPAPLAPPDPPADTSQVVPESPVAITRETSSSSSYQMSTQARALLEDVRARRESVLVSNSNSPFPDLDRTLQVLNGENGAFGDFNFNLDPKLANDEDADASLLPDLDTVASVPYRNNNFNPYLQGQPSTQQAIPVLPSIAGSYPSSPNPAFMDAGGIGASMMVKRSTSTSSYSGSFNPFVESRDERSSSPATSAALTPGDDPDRKVSRFGFARERQGSFLSNTSSPLHSADASIYSPSDTNLPSSNSAHAPWPFQRLLDLGPLPTMPPRTSTPSSLRNSPLVPHAVAQPTYNPQASRFQPFDTPATEISLKDLIGVGRERTHLSHFVPNGFADQRGGMQLQPNQPFQDPVILASVPYGATNYIDTPYSSPGLVGNAFSPHIFPGPPSGLVTSPPQLLPSISIQGGNDVMPSPTQSRFIGYSNESAAVNGSNIAPSSAMPTQAVVTTSPVLSSADFPALPTAVVEAQAKPEQPPQPHITSSNIKDIKVQTKPTKRVEKAEEKDRVVPEKSLERDRTVKTKSAQKERAVREKPEKVSPVTEKIDKKVEKKLEKEKVQKTNGEKATNIVNKKAVREQTPVQDVQDEYPSVSLLKPMPTKTALRNGNAKSVPIAESVQVETQAVPILSKMPKKNKPIIPKPIRVSREEETESSTGAQVTPVSDNVDLPNGNSMDVTEVIPSELGDVDEAVSSSDDVESGPKPLEIMLEEIDAANPDMNMSSHPFFDLTRLNPAAKMPLEYSPLVHALSALSVGGGSFANHVPTGSIDNAVSSFQQLLETLTQTISDLLRLLPRTTWDDSSSFDGVLRDMLKGDDFLEEGGDDQSVRDDEVVALTLALERRARWMEVQLAKLEELHRDINTAAVRAVLAFNDRGWDAQGLLPRVGNTLKRFDNLGFAEEDGKTRAMTADELEEKLTDAQDATAFAEAELRQSMESLQGLKPVYDD